MRRLLVGFNRFYFRGFLHLRPGRLLLLETLTGLQVFDRRIIFGTHASKAGDIADAGQSESHRRREKRPLPFRSARLQTDLKFGS